MNDRESYHLRDGAEETLKRTERGEGRPGGSEDTAKKDPERDRLGAEPDRESEKFGFNTRCARRGPKKRQDHTFHMHQ